MQVKTKRVLFSLVISAIIFGFLLGYLVGNVSADLSDETQELVEDLRWKHYPFFYIYDDTERTWEQSYPYIKFEDGILYIVDKDGTWFIELERKEE